MQPIHVTLGTLNLTQADTSRSVLHLLTTQLSHRRVMKSCHPLHPAFLFSSTQKKARH
jgi:hypothetical protein